MVLFCDTSRDLSCPFEQNSSSILQSSDYVEMEHLFLLADQKSVVNGVTAAYLSDILEDDWTTIRHDFRK